MNTLPLLDIEGLCVTFGGLRAVDALSFQVQAGEIHGLIGPNGAGKTTVFNVITRIYKPDTGRVSLLGRDVLALKPHEVVAIGIARTFQNNELFGSLSVLDNVLAGQHTRVAYNIASSMIGGRRIRAEEERAQGEALRLLEIVKLHQHADVPAASLSFGQQRMLELARALATQPKLLLLDEPAAGMNSRESSELSELLRLLRADFKIGILLVEHDMRVVMDICGRITVMQYGQKICQGTPTEVRNNPQVIEAYLGRRRSDPTR